LNALGLDDQIKAYNKALESNTDLKESEKYAIRQTLTKLVKEKKKIDDEKKKAEEALKKQ